MLRFNKIPEMLRPYANALVALCIVGCGNNEDSNFGEVNNNTIVIDLDIRSDEETKTLAEIEEYIYLFQTNPESALRNVISEDAVLLAGDRFTPVYVALECSKCEKNICLTCKGEKWCGGCKGEKTCSKCKGEYKTKTECRSCICKTCKGSGICINCNGKKAFRCETCNGRKGSRCLSCKGSGRGPYEYIDCDACVNGNIKITFGNGYRRCPKCAGRGHIQSLPTRCQSCDGKGLIPCNSCKGAGFFWCESCSGTGKCSSCVDGRYSTCTHCDEDHYVVSLCELCQENPGVCSVCDGIGLCVICEGKGTCTNLHNKISSSEVYYFPSTLVDTENTSLRYVERIPPGESNEDVIFNSHTYSFPESKTPHIRVISESSHNIIAITELIQ